MARNVFALLDALTSTVTELRTVLAPLAALASGPAAPNPRPARARARRRKSAAAKPSPPTAPAPKSAKAPPASKKLTPAQALHIQYLTALRTLGAGDQAKVKKVRAKDGAEAAVKMATSLAK